MCTVEAAAYRELCLVQSSTYGGSFLATRLVRLIGLLLGPTDCVSKMAKLARADDDQPEEVFRNQSEEEKNVSRRKYSVISLRK